jgi:hypothetical protein
VTAVFSGGTNFDRRFRDKEGFLLAATSPQPDTSVRDDPSVEAE